jgi:hypothetical protein
MAKSPITGEFPEEGLRRDLRGIGHSTGFELALASALSKWNPDEDATTMTVTLEVDIQDNPGGIGTYRVYLS